METICILGRQPALGLAELESLFGADNVQVCGSQAAIINMPVKEFGFKRLGGVIKVGSLLTTIESTDWRKVEAGLISLVPTLAASLTDGKIQLGISTYGFDIPIEQIMATGLTLKKQFKKSGRTSVRVVPNKTPELNSASVLHNQLRGDHGVELLIIRNSGRTVVARTTDVQDIDNYTVRDRGRPKRDARVGMLPPKLAQIIINLAAANTKPSHGSVILDPFCGTGVILQEATLMGFDVYGSDLDPRMVDYSDVNLLWLLEQPFCPVWFSEKQRLPDANNPDWRYYNLEQADATSHTWKPTSNIIASETYLGKPFTSLPSPEILNRTITECNVIIKKFLQNIGGQIAAGSRLCLAVPAWQIRPGSFKHLPLLDSLGHLGYNLISFEHVRNEDLIYYRTGQIVARQLLVITKS